MVVYMDVMLGCPLTFGHAVFLLFLWGFFCKIFHCNFKSKEIKTSVKSKSALVTSRG